jgi:DNA-binding Lrp family transcriptional regulator
MSVTLKHRIIELLSQDTRHNSISDISKKLKVAYSHAHSFVKQLVKENIIRTEKIGNVLVCSLNLSEPLTVTYLSFMEAGRAAEWKRKNPHSAKIMEKIELVKDNVHAVLIRNNNVILLVPERITGVDFTMFRNRTVITRTQLKKKKAYYKDCIILYGAEKYWSLLAD